MLSMIASIMSSALGLVLNKARTTAAVKLKDGDTTDEKLRDVIIEDLNDIKTKIDGLSRKDLLTSYCFLKVGVVALNLALDEAKDEQTNKDDANGGQYGGSQTTATTTRNESESGVLNEAIALSHAIQKLENTSNGRLVSAKESFRDAFKEATRAFCNEALSLPDRIMAAKLRVVSKILECLQDTKLAAAGCMLFLEELHNLPAIGETCSTYFKGGIKSMFYKDSRLDNVKSVLSLNFAISEFVARFSGELPNVRDWPRIHLPTRETIHPLLLHTDVAKEIFDMELMEEFQLPENQIVIDISDLLMDIRNECFINSKGQILSLFIFEDCINIFNRSGDMKTFCRIRQATANLKGYKRQDVMALAIDRHDNIFVIIRVENDVRYVFVLFVFDSSGNEQYERVLDFLEVAFIIYAGRSDILDIFNIFETRKSIECVVNNDGDIIIHFRCDDYLHVCDSNGNLKSALSLPRQVHYLDCVTDQNEIVMHDDSDVFVFTKEGKVKRTINVKNDITALIFNYVTSKIEILVSKESILNNDSCYILSYSENDEVERLFLPLPFIWNIKMFCSHPAGPAALIYNAIITQIVFI